MEPAERLERLERVLARLDEDSHGSPIVVEGLRDEAALRALGVTGEIMVYNRGGSVLDVADRLRGRRSVVLLLDWDRKGGQLTRLLRAQLEGVIRIDLEPRKELAYVSLVKCVEDLPHARRTLRARLADRSARHDAD